MVGEKGYALVVGVKLKIVKKVECLLIEVMDYSLKMHSLDLMVLTMYYFAIIFDPS